MSHIFLLLCINALDNHTHNNITAEDISLFLISRFGIVVTEEEVEDQIMSGLGGGNSGDEVIDLMEVAAILLIPTILKAAKVEVQGEALSDRFQKPDPHLLKQTLEMMLDDATGDCTQPKQLTSDLICKIFTAYGDTDLAEDEDLHHEMIAAAQNGIAATSFDHDADNESGGGLNLDLKTFAAGLTADIQDYDLNNELRSTTHYDDIMLTRGGRDITRSSQLITATQQSQANLSLAEVKSRKSKSTLLVKRFTAPAIDSTNGNYRSKSLIILLWITGILSYFAYWFHPEFLSQQSEEDADDSGCPEYETSSTTRHPWTTNADAIACETAWSIANWLARFIIFRYV